MMRDKLFSSFPLGIIFHLADGRINEINQSAENILGIDKREMKGKTWQELPWTFLCDNGIEIPPAENPVHLAMTKGQELRHCIMGMLDTETNQCKWISIDAVPCREGDSNQGGNSQGYITFSDVTTDVRTREYCSDLILNANLGTWEWNIETGSTRFNERWAEIVGYSLEELYPVNIDTWKRLTHPDDLETSYLRLKDHFEGRSNLYQCEIRMKHKNGQWIWVLDTGKVIQWTRDGKPYLISGIHQDITRLKETEQKLHLKLELEKFIAGLSSKFIQTNDVDKTIHESFGELAALNNASRVYLFQFEQETQSMSNTHEWCNDGVTPELDNLQNLPLTLFPWWMEKLRMNEIIDVPDVERMPPEASAEKEILQVQGIKSVLVLPVMNNNNLMGFIGFDNVMESTAWSFRDSYLLGLVSNIIAHALERKTNEAKIRTSLENLRNFFDLHTDYVTVLNEEGQIIRVNDKLLKDLEYREDEVIGKPALDLHPPEVRENATVILGEIQKGIRRSCPLPIVAKNGQWKQVETMVSKGFWDGKPVLFGISKNISELKFSEEKFSRIFQNSPAITGLIESESGLYVEVNQAFSDTLGYSVDETIGKCSGEVDRMVFKQREIAEEKLNKDGFIRNAEAILYHKDGRALDCIVSISCIQILGKKYRLTIAVDVSEQVKARQELILLNQAIESSPVGTMITDSQGFVTYVNHGFESITGYKKHEVFGKKPSFLNSGQHSESFYASIKSTLLQGKPWQGEIFNKTKNGNIICVNELVSPLVHEETITHFVSFAQDITENKNLYFDLLKAKEQAEESDRLKSAFLATMSHELRTPLGHILGFSDMISDISEDENIREFSGLIYKSGTNLLNIIEDIFNLTMMEQSGITLRSEEIDIRDLYLDMKKLLKDTLRMSNKSNNIRLVFRADSQIITRMIITDKSKIIQVVSNLIRNAVKFTHEGEISLSLRLTEDNCLSVSVKDTGIGIPQDKQDVIFGFFRQIDDTHSRKYEGVGIGLAISQKIAHVMRGKITVKSVPGSGSEFTYTFPVKFYEEDLDEIESYGSDGK